MWPGVSPAAPGILHSVASLYMLEQAGVSFSFIVLPALPSILTIKQDACQSLREFRRNQGFLCLAFGSQGLSVISLA